MLAHVTSSRPSTETAAGSIGRGDRAVDLLRFVVVLDLDVVESFHAGVDETSKLETSNLALAICDRALPESDQDHEFK